MGTEIKYLETGAEVIVLGKAADKFIIRHVLDEDECDEEMSEPLYGEPRLVGKVYDSPPRDRIDAEILRLNELIATRREEARTLGAEVDAATKARVDIAKLAGRNSALTRIADFLDGKITHFVEDDYSGVCVHTFVEATHNMRDYGGRWDGTIKLLTLYGDTKGDLGWRLNRYSDGSGCGTSLYPCCSEEEAHATAQRLIAERIANTADRPQDSLIKNAEALGVEVAVEYRRGAIEHDLKNVMQSRDKSDAEFSTLTEKFNDLTAALAALPVDNEASDE